MNNNERYNPPAVLNFIFLSFLFLLVGCGTPAKKEKATIKTVTNQKENETSNNVILCFGNSLTEGFGVKSKEAYPALLQNKIDSLNLNYQVVNAGISGETTSGGKNRLSWVLKPNVKIFILELGANDGLRGIPLKETEKNLQEIIDTVRAKLPKAKIVLAGMQIPPNLGQDYTNGFKAIFPRLAEKNNTFIIPFLLQNVAGNPNLNQSDGVHPTPEGYKIVVENVWEVLGGLIE